MAERSIAQIDEAEVKQIVAGQAVSDLSSCAKELIDNALDAKATNVQVKLINQGYDAIEVSDNGTGISPENRCLVATKHATSKLRQFSDLYSEDSCSTLGFRGEALFCLANVSESLCVTTRFGTERTAKKLWYTRNGQLDASRTSQVARSTVGTTVLISKLFAALPVRRVDMKKRLKSQRQKLFQLIQSYAIICAGVRFHVTDVSTGKKGSKKVETKLATNANSNVQQTISCVLGSKFLSGLTSIKVDLSSCFSGERYESDVKIDSTTGSFRIEGFISRVPSTNSFVSRDLQFFAINGRPVDLPIFSKALSEAWRIFDTSNSKKPACVLKLYLPNNAFDGKPIATFFIACQELAF